MKSFMLIGGAMNITLALPKIISEMSGRTLEISGVDMQSTVNLAIGVFAITMGLVKK